MQRKAQGISINAIVIMAIAVLVLVVLATLLISRSSNIAVELEKCPGVCKERTSQPNQGCENTLDGFQRPSSGACTISGTNEVDRTKVCCIPGSSS